jgi:hypothetical protein
MEFTPSCKRVRILCNSTIRLSLVHNRFVVAVAVVILMSVVAPQDEAPTLLASMADSVPEKVLTTAIPLRNRMTFIFDAVLNQAKALTPANESDELSQNVRIEITITRPITDFVLVTTGNGKVLRLLDDRLGTT